MLPNSSPVRRAVQHRLGRCSRRRPETCGRPRCRRACRTARRRRARLRRVLGDAVRGLARRRLAIADREPADLARRAQVALEQRRRERLHVGDVVEALAERVGRQERGDVDVEREQIVHGARVLGAVQTLERPPARIRRAPRPRDRSAFRAIPRTPSASRRPDVGAPGGGIMPARSLRIIFSVDFGVLARLCAASKCSSDSPPVFASSSWQVAQLAATSAFCASTARGRLQMSTRVEKTEPPPRRGRDRARRRTEWRRGAGGAWSASPRQQDTHLWLFFAPSPSSSLIVSGNG